MRRPAASLTLSVLGTVLLANWVVANAHEGSEWTYASRLREAYLSESLRWAEPLDNAFVVDAPRRQRRAGVFTLPHDAALSVASRRGLPALEGDVLLVPTRLGTFYSVDLENSGRDAFRWLPWNEVNAIHYSTAAGFRCAASARIQAPPGEERSWTAPLRPSPGCAAELPLSMAAGLIGTEYSPGAGRGPFVPAAPGLEVAARAAAEPGRLRLELVWRTDRRREEDFVMLPRLVCADGRSFETVYPTMVQKRAVSTLWPLFNDILPPSSWRSGRNVRETWLLTLPDGSRCSGDARLRLELRSLPRRAPSTPLGSAELTVRL